MGLAAGCRAGQEVWRVRTADVKRGRREKDIFLRGDNMAVTSVQNGDG